MKTFAWVLGLTAFTFAMWGAFMWVFGEFGIFFVVITGFTLPVWGHILVEVFGGDED